MKSKTKQHSKAELPKQEFVDGEGSRHDLGIDQEQNTADEDAIRWEETVTAQRAFTNYQIYIGVAVIAVLVILLWRETHTNGSRLTKVESTLDKLLKGKDYFNIIDILDKKVDDLSTKIKDASYSLTRLDNEIQVSERRMNGIDKRLDDEEKNLEVATSDLKELIGKQNDLRHDLNESNKQLDKVKGKSETIEKYIETSSKDMVLSVAKIEELDQQFSESERKSKNVTETQSNLQREVLTIELKLKGFSNNMSAIDGRLPGFETKTDEILQKLKDAEVKHDQMMKLDADATTLGEKISDIGEKSKTTEKTVLTLETKIKTFDNGLDTYENKLENAKKNQETLGEDIAKLKTVTQTTSENIEKVSGKTETLMTNVEKTEQKVKEKLPIIEKKITDTGSDVQKLEKEVEKVKEYTDQQVPEIKTRLKEVAENVKNYTDQQVPALKSLIKDVEKTANFPYICVMDILEIIAIIMIFLSMRDSSFRRPATTMAGPSGTTRDASNYVRPQSILGKICRAPVLDNKICIVSFYSETLNLHKTMLGAALQNSRRAQGFQIVQNLIKRHEDILEIPKARYIFVFVDFNERNVILENPGQDLGDKKLVTVQATCKLGANVFVTYVRDKGSRTLPPGALYNTELTAFNSHFFLKGLTSQSRCFSVYESFSQSQKEHIAAAVH